MRGKVLKLIVSGMLGLSLLAHGTAAHACSCETPSSEQLSHGLKVVDDSLNANFSGTGNSQDEQSGAVDFDEAHCSSSCIGFVTKSEARFFADSIRRVHPLRSLFRVSSFDFSIFKPPRA